MQPIIRRNKYQEDEYHILRKLRHAIIVISAIYSEKGFHSLFTASYIVGVWPSESDHRCHVSIRTNRIAPSSAARFLTSLSVPPSPRSGFRRMVDSRKRSSSPPKLRVPRASSPLVQLLLPSSGQILLEKAKNTMNE